MLPLVKSYYVARATGYPIQFAPSSNGNMQIAVEFQVEDHPEFSGDTITWIGHFTDATAERTLESLQIAGWQGEDVSELSGKPGNEALPDLVSLACDVDEYKGEQRLRVQWVNRPKGHFKFQQSADPGALRALGARLRATAKAVRESGGAPKKPSQHGGGGGGQAHPNAPGNRDDIPFASSAIEHEPSLVAPVLLRTV